MALLRRILAAGDATVELPLEQMRANFEKFAGLFPGIEGVEVTPLHLGGVAAEKVVVAVDPALPVPPGHRGAILYLHGGGFVTGSAKSHRMLAARLAAAAQATCFVLDYRLAPEHPFPAALADTLAAWEALLASHPGPLALAGDSAGAGLAVLAASRLVARGQKMPAAMALFSPWGDLEGCPSVDRQEDPMVRRPGLEKMARFYLGGRDPWDPEVTPLRADLHGLPPLLLQVGGADALRDDALALAARLRAHGVHVTFELWPGMIHLWHLFASRLDEGAAALVRGGAFLRLALDQEASLG